MRARRGLVFGFVAATVFPVVAAADDPPPAASAPPASPTIHHPLAHPNDPLPHKVITPPWLKPLPPGSASGAPRPATPFRPPPAMSGAPAPNAPAPNMVMAPKRHAQKKPKPPPAPSSVVHLTIDAPSIDGPWTMRAENAAKVPVEIVADARLLALDVTSPDGKKTTRCALPSAMRPHDVDDRVLVVPPGRAFVEKIDPRLFCFGAHASEALEPGAKVQPVLAPGADEGDALRAIDGVEPAIASEHDLVGVASPIASAVTSRPVASAATQPRPVAISSAPFADAGRAQDADVDVTVTNEGTAPARFLFRTETLAFDVTGPSGIGVTDPSPTVHCGVKSDESFAPIAEVLTTLAPKEHASLGVLLAALCPDKTLDHPGLYVVRAHLDTRGASGKSIGLRTFDGEATATTTTRLRIQTASDGAPLPRPKLAPEGP